jgi:hypothetical protein
LLLTLSASVGVAMDCCYAPSTHGSADGQPPQLQSSATPLHDEMKTTSSMQYGSSLAISDNNSTTTNELDNGALLELSNNDDGAATALLLVAEPDAVKDEAVASSLAIAWNDDDQAKLKAAVARGPEPAAAAATLPGAVSVVSALALQQQGTKNDNVLQQHSQSGGDLDWGENDFVTAQHQFGLRNSELSNGNGGSWTTVNTVVGTTRPTWPWP